MTDMSLALLLPQFFEKSLNFAGNCIEIESFSVWSKKVDEITTFWEWTFFKFGVISQSIFDVHCTMGDFYYEGSKKSKNLLYWNFFISVYVYLKKARYYKYVQILSKKIDFNSFSSVKLRFKICSFAMFARFCQYLLHKKVISSCWFLENTLFHPSHGYDF